MPGRITIKAKWQRRQSKKAGSMNTLERAYAERLQSLVLLDEIHDWRYEPFKLRLADNTGFTPDFMVLRSDGTIEFHEVKGFWEDDARVKIKVAAELYPWFTFVAASRKRARDPWQFETFGDEDKGEAR
ncbi:MAG: DUF1064 domain-containing protein [Acidiferrobacteraceae bacterium]